jgi:hypothetical protein
MMTVLIWLTVLLKIPIGGLVWMWWVTRPADKDEEGGARFDAQLDPHPCPRLPPRPRRGPHTGAAPPAPPRIRSVIARAESAARQH